MDVTTLTGIISAAVAFGAGFVAALVAIRPLIQQLRDMAEVVTPGWEADEKFLQGIDEGVGKVIDALEAFGFERAELEEALGAEDDE